MIEILSSLWCLPYKSKRNCLVLVVQLGVGPHEAGPSCATRDNAFLVGAVHIKKRDFVLE